MTRGGSDGDEEHRVRPAYAARTLRLRRNPLWLVGAATPLLFGAGLIGAAAAGVEAAQGLAAVLGPVGVVAGLVFTRQVWRDDPSPRLEPGVLTIDAQAARWNGEVVASLDGIERVTYHRANGVTVVRIHKGGADPKLVVDDEAEARRVIALLGFGAERSTAKFVGMSRIVGLPTARRRWLQVALVLGVILTAIATEALLQTSTAFLAAIVVGLAVVTALRHLPTTIEVGADALALRWLGRTRIVPLADLESVAPTTLIEKRSRGGPDIYHAVDIEVRGEPPTTICFGTDDLDLGQRDHLVERVREVQAMRGRAAAATGTAFLARGDRDAAMWVRALREGSASEGGMRTAAVPLERLWSLVEDAAYGATDRAAAAVALGSRANGEDRARIRVAANRTIDPKLRIALDRAADEEADIEAMAEALEAVDKTRR